jgi:hypothetical protein
VRRHQCPRERRGLDADLTEVIVNMVSTGSVLGITAAVNRFRKRVPQAKVVI